MKSIFENRPFPLLLCDRSLQTNAFDTFVVGNPGPIDTTLKAGQSLPQRGSYIEYPGFL
ncbi:hypothetical protein AWB74_07864 [Caballeronia arvi]|uniref:Uncharacterized protein n=1 Tax=Caballeronia arvi TaxID=1777135 RepID=A0A158L0F3_9BURK|nr:hypothetical protein [Caballeronia arvi]SAL86832.1 hypothetical protein AWB74_07864 [Caballeronia arvi]